jgi:hypothetical protein
MSQLRTNLECSIGQAGFPPQAPGAMLVESLQQTVSLAARNRLAEYVLFDGVRPLGHMQGCHPQGRAQRKPALGLRGVPIGKIERYKEASVGVDAQ